MSFKLGSTVRLKKPQYGSWLVGVVTSSGDKYTDVVALADNRNKESVYGYRYSFPTDYFVMDDLAEDKDPAAEDPSPDYEKLVSVVRDLADESSRRFMMNESGRLEQLEDRVEKLVTRVVKSPNNDDYLELERRLQDAEEFINTLKGAIK